MIPAIVKYGRRFGLALLVVVPLMYWFGGSQGVVTLMRKVILCFTGAAAAELVWSVFFKPEYGKTEEAYYAMRLLALLLFRGILYGSFILGCALGL